MEAPMPQAWLEMADGRMLWLEKGACTLGRSTGCTHILDLPGISRSHAMLQPGPSGGFLLRRRSTRREWPATPPPRPNPGAPRLLRQPVSPLIPCTGFHRKVFT